MYEPAGHPTRHVRLHACPMDPVGWSLVITGTTELARAHTTVTKSASVSFDLVRQLQPVALVNRFQAHGGAFWPAPLAGLAVAPANKRREHPNTVKAT